jgi:hypothetical protein
MNARATLSNGRTAKENGGGKVCIYYKHFKINCSDQQLGIRRLKDMPHSNDIYGAPAVVKRGVVNSSRLGYERIGLLWRKQGMGTEFFRLLSPGM